MKRKILSAVIIGLFAANAAIAAGKPAQKSGIETANMDKAVRAQDDFYQHQNGAWLKNTEIPAERSSWGTFVQLSDTVQAGVVGADTWGTEVVPAKDPACVFCVHAHLLARHGIVNQENMDLDALAADRAWRFLYLYTPVPIVGATGSIGAPLAVR